MKVTVFSEVSIDGKLTLGEGSSSKDLFSLLDNNDMEFIHNFRGQVDGIMVGRKTIETDNPSLTNRYEKNNDPLRIIPTRSLNIPADSNVLTDNVATVFATIDTPENREKIKEIEALGKKCVITGKDKIDFRVLFEVLEAEYNVKSIMLEGGGTLNWSLFQDDLVDEMILMQLPIIIGGSKTPSLADGLGFTEVERTKKFEIVELEARKNYTLLKFNRKRCVDVDTCKCCA